MLVPTDHRRIVPATPTWDSTTEAAPTTQEAAAEVGPRAGVTGATLSHLTILQVRHRPLLPLLPVLLRLYLRPNFDDKAHPTRRRNRQSRLPQLRP